MTPGTQPQSVSRNTMSIEPQPRSITASGGKIMAKMTWRQDMVVVDFLQNKRKDVLIIQNHVFSISLNLNKTHISFCQLKIYDLEQHHP